MRPKGKDLWMVVIRRRLVRTETMHRPLLIWTRNKDWHRCYLLAMTRSRKILRRRKRKRSTTKATRSSTTRCLAGAAGRARGSANESRNGEKEELRRLSKACP